MAEWDAADPQPTVTAAQVADQIEHVARIARIDHVGIGSDFEGMGSFVIADLKDAASVRVLLGELMLRGWGDVALHKLARGNVPRVKSLMQYLA